MMTKMLMKIKKRTMRKNTGKKVKVLLDAFA